MCTIRTGMPDCFLWITAPYVTRSSCVLDFLTNKAEHSLPRVTKERQDVHHSPRMFLQVGPTVSGEDSAENRWHITPCNKGYLHALSQKDKAHRQATPHFHVSLAYPLAGHSEQLHLP